MKPSFCGLMPPRMLRQRGLLSLKSPGAVGNVKQDLRNSDDPCRADLGLPPGASLATYLLRTEEAILKAALLHSRGDKTSRRSAKQMEAQVGLAIELHKVASTIARFNPPSRHTPHTIRPSTICI